MLASMVRRAGAIAVAVAVVGAQGLVGLGMAPPAAAVGEALPNPPSAVPLTAVQIDGVAWQQVVVGDTVYVGGSFTTARPAGAAPGQNTVTRQNVLAFDIRTGALRSGFVANTNAQVRGVAASPDGSRIYISGEFTSVNGVSRQRIAALNPTTGAVITSFQAGADYRVTGMVATADTVYVGGSFTNARGAARVNLAAFRASDGAVLNWAPTADNGQVLALAMLPGSGKMVVAGAFTALNGVEAHGIGAVDPTTGITVPYPVNEVVRNQGPDGAVYSLTTDAEHVYGSGYTFGRTGGNFEGNFQADPAGNLVWLNDIHGDQYDVHSSRGMLFSVGHAHADGNVAGGQPQETPSRNMYSLTQTTDVRGVLQANTTNTSRYFDFPGLPAPEVVHWWPDFTPGTYTDANMAGWSVSGNDQYLVVAGEFTRVNNVNQQGIVRFAFRDTQSLNDAPRLGGATMVPDVTSPAAGVVQVSWQANYDRDHNDLTYEVQREGSGTVATYAARSAFYQRPVLTHLDEGVAPGSTQRYRIVTNDPAGARVFGDYVSVTVADVGSLSDYAKGVLADRPAAFYRLSDSGTAMVDSAYTSDGTTAADVVRGVPGAIPGDTNTASRFAGGTQTARNTTAMPTPTSLSTEAWIRTTTATGGMIIGYGNRASGSSSSSSSDYRTYMGTDGRIHFGVYEASRGVVSSTTSYNDGKWHHVVSTLDWASGQRLYVDGVLVAQNPNVKHGRNFDGYWRIGGDTLSQWPSRPGTDYFTGDIDEVAVYLEALPAGRVAAHFQNAGGTLANQVPVAGFTSQVSDLRVSVDGSGSQDPDGSVESYAWDFGDGGSESGVTASHTYAAAGQYTVTLTVTDDDGATDTESAQVTVTAPALFVVDAFDRTRASGLGAATVGGTWGLTGSSSLYSVDGSVGRVTLSSAGVKREVSQAISQADIDLRVSVGMDKPATGGGVYVSIGGRDVGTTSYLARLRFYATGAVVLQNQRLVSGAATTLTGGGVVPGLTYQPGQMLTVRMQISGSSPSTIRSKVWVAGTEEPTAWLATSTDSTAALEAPGGVYVEGYLSGSVTNAPVTLLIDDVTVAPIG